MYKTVKVYRATSVAAFEGLYVWPGRELITLYIMRVGFERFSFCFIVIDKNLHLYNITDQLTSRCYCHGNIAYCIIFAFGV